MNDFERRKARFDFLKKMLEPTHDSRERIESLYLPTYEWCLSQLKTARPVILGVSGSQGAGKSTLTRTLCELLNHEGFRAVTISIDDFYLTRVGQVRLAHRHPGNPYLQSRGYPGTHDLALGTQVLKEVRGERGTVAIPSYEKSLFEGKGDRLPRSSWKSVDLPLDLIFFEGWMIGFRAVDESTISNPALLEINHLLRSYEEWWSQLDAMIQLKPADYHYVVDWRVEAEERMKASGKPGMTEAEIRAYATSFLPAYELYLPGISLSKPSPRLTIEIGRDRLPIREAGPGSHP